MKNSGVTAAKRPDGRPVVTPYQPGQSGNPAGKPKGSVSIRAELQKIIDLTIKNEHNPISNEVEAKMSVSRKIALNMALKACEGDMWAMKEVRDTIDGKPSQSLNLGGQEHNPLKMDVQAGITAAPDNLVSAIAKAIKESA